MVGLHVLAASLLFFINISRASRMLIGRLGRKEGKGWGCSEIPQI